MERLLENKICIVTGAAQGIGREIAKRFAADGAVVYACDRQELSEAKIKELEEQKIHYLSFDLTDAAAVKSAMMQIFKAEGRIDVLVNNAGVVFNRKIGMIVREETELMFRINVIAVIELIQLVSRLMARNGGGSIVNIAFISLTKSAAKELAAQGIRVNAVAPGIVKTERFAELYEANGEKIDERISRIAMGRLGTPEDIANACSFLASDRASYISGQIVGVDGCAAI